MDFVVKHLCRLCLIKPEHPVNVTSNEHLKEKFRTFFKIDVNPENQLPSVICSSCSQTIEHFAKFCDKVAENQGILLQKIATIIKNESSSPTQTDDLNNEDDVDRLAESFPNSADEDDINEDFAELKYEILNKKVDARLRSSRKRKLVAKQDIDTDNSTSESKLDKVTKKPNRRQAESDDDDIIRTYLSLECDQCENRQVFNTFTQLIIHFKLVHNTRGYITCCDKKFYRKYILVNHITRHLNPEAYKCEMCGKISKSKSQLQVHMKLHLPADQRAHECSTCNQRFPTKSHLNQHIFSHLPDSAKKFTCDECGKAFGFKNALAQHKLTHSSERNFVCEDCGQSFAVKSYLKNHINYAHNGGPKPKVQCHICQLWYKNKNTLRGHMKKHKDQKEYKCEHCDKIYATRVGWLGHVRYIHKQIFRHECNICERKFRRKCELMNHMAKHTGQPLCKCEYCGREFVCRSHCSKHRKKCRLLT